jgi:peptidoglycan/LPS O-acetylase OafA/YrhL
VESFGRMGPDPRGDDGRLPRSVPALDGVRGAAALLVVLTHVGYQTGEVVHGAHGAALARMDFGVALFFVLSGLLLYRPWVAAEGSGHPGPPWRRYFWRRAIRILPAYWVALAAVVLTSGDHSTRDVVHNATLIQVYGGGHLLEDFTQTWSLCTEVSFYAVLPVVAAAAARLRPVVRVWAAAAVVLGSLVWTGAAADGLLPRYAGTWLPGHADWFVYGLVLAALADRHRRAPTGRIAAWVEDFRHRPGSLLLLAASLGAVALTPLAGPRTLALSSPAESVLKETLYGAVAVLVVGAALVAHPRTVVARVLTTTPARWCGRVGYGVFLWHLLVLDAAMNLLGTQLFGGDFLRVAALTVVGSLLVASVSWLVVERPLLDRLSRPVSSGRGRPAEPEPDRGDEREQRGDLGGTATRQRL